MKLANLSGTETLGTERYMACVEIVTAWDSWAPNNRYETGARSWIFGWPNFLASFRWVGWNRSRSYGL